MSDRELTDTAGLYPANEKQLAAYLRAMGVPCLGWSIELTNGREYYTEWYDGEAECEELAGEYWDGPYRAYADEMAAFVRRSKKHISYK